MELRQYWNVIWRRRWLVLAIVLLTAIISGAMFLRAPLTYQADSRFITRQAPNSSGAEQYLFVNQPNGYWIGSEFLVDDYVEVVKSDAFAASVLAITGDKLTLGKTTATITRDNIKAAIDADRKARELHVMVKGYTRDETKLLSDAVATVLTELRFKPIKGQMVDDKPIFSQIDEATPDTIQSSRSKELINAIVRVIIGLAVALVLAFLLEYLDTSVRDESDARRVLDLPVLGAIPRA